MRTPPATPVCEAQPDGGTAARRDLSVSLARANVLMVIFAVPAVTVSALPYLLLHDWRGLYYLTANSSALLWLLIAVVAGIFIHEGIHAWTWMLAAGKSREAIRFGMNWKLLTPYAHCTEPMRARPYRIGAAMPLMIVGLLPTLASWLTGDPAQLLFGLFFTFAAGGDMLILWMLRGVSPGTMVEDHPSRAGCYVFDEPHAA